MRIYFRIQILMMLLAGALFACRQAEAQSFGLSISNSPGPILVNGNITYAISVTNRTGLLVTNFFVTNALSAPVQFLSASSTYGTNNTVLTNATRLIFIFPRFTNGDVAHMTFNLKPTTTGFLTNTITAAVTNPVASTSTNVIVQVVAPQTDLAVSFSGVPQSVALNDQMTYNISVANLGSNAVSSFILTNTLPPGVVFKNVSPTITSQTVSNNLVFHLGALAAGATNTWQFTVQPTNSGLLTFLAEIVQTNFADANPANDIASTNIDVEDFTGNLIATNLSAMFYDPQTGLMDQPIRLSNIGTNAVPAARVIVSGLTNRLYNANGTNNGKPYVTYGSALDTNQSVDLILEFFIPTRVPITISNSQYTAVGVGAVNFSATGGTNGTFDVVRTKMLTNSVAMPNFYFLVEFSSVAGRSYSIIYSDDLSFSNALVAQPAVIAPADKTQWIDDGPPKTVSVPSISTPRYYRILQNP